MIYKTKIKSVQLWTNVSHRFRVTKGGKKILTGDPEYQIRLKVGIDPLEGLKNGDYVMSRGMQFRYCGDTLISVNDYSSTDFQLDTKEDLEIYFIGRYATS